MSTLHDTMDVHVWVDEWLKTIQADPAIPTDRDTMVTWFANAIQTGYQFGHQRATTDAAYEAAGIDL